MNTELYEKLTKLAYQRSKPFCYQCYCEAPTGTCSQCMSCDLMRLVDGVGCEYGTQWIIEHILQAELTSVDTESIFEEMIRSCYPEETTVGWMKFDTCDLMKTQDPTSWRIARDEYVESLIEDEQLVTFDNGTTYYWISDVDTLCDE